MLRSSDFSKKKNGPIYIYIHSPLKAASEDFHTQKPALYVSSLVLLKLAARTEVKVGCGF